MALGAAAVMGGTQLAGGLMRARVEAEQAKRDRILRALQIEMEGKQQAAQQLQTGTQNAIGQMMGGFGQALR